MQKLLYLFIASILFLSCERELQYTSDYNFEIRNVIETPVYVNSAKPFQLEITNKKNMSENKEYIFSYKILTGMVTIKKGITTMIAEKNYTVTESDMNMIDLQMTALNTDELIIEFTLTDNNNVTKKQNILITPEVLALPFTLTKVAEFNLKSTQQKNFQFTLSGIVATNTYEVKFSGNNPSKIYKTSGAEILKNQWIPLTLAQTSTYTYTYEALSDTNDDLEVQVRDNFGQVGTINYAVTILPKPMINNYNITLFRTTNNSGGSLRSCTGVVKSNTFNTIYGGATLSKTKIIIRNKLTGAYDTIEFTNSNTVNELETIYKACFTSGIGGSGCNTTAMSEEVLQYSKYAGQLYNIQIQDSDGVWSDVKNGTVLN
jgi:hypothetical protein